MKIKSLLSFFVPAAMMSLAVAGCSDYDNGYSEQAIKFAQEFRSTFGDIDPEQDWNLAERGTVTVTTSKESEVKIYAKTSDAFSIVGDYEGVKGTRTLGFDMVEGTKEIIVSDGVQGIKTVPGGSVNFGGTRVVYEGTTNDVKVTKLTSDVEINGETFPQYRTSTTAEVKAMLATVPEMTNNLDKVTHDFSYVSTGSFIIYPFYWNTSSVNTLGLYYTDDNGQYHEVDIYKGKDGENGGELWFATPAVTDDLNGWNISNMSNGNGSWYAFQTQNNHGNDQDDPSGIVAPFNEYWRSNALGNATISKTFTVSSPNAECIVEVAARLRNQNGTQTSGLGTVYFTANGSSVELTGAGNNTTGTYTYSGKTQGNLYSNMDGTKKISVRCTSDSNGRVNVSFQLNNVSFNWFSFKDLTITLLDQNVSNMTPAGTYQDPNNSYNQSFPTTAVKGQGIMVDIPAGTKFGMYIKKSDYSGAYTLYSESTKNEADSRLTQTCYASTFYVGDQMFLGFEDWPNGDADLNDLVLAYDGAKPIIINEDPEEGGTWLLACEDLGGSFDIDYNDVVFMVEHISGKTTAKLTPLAAGGTLASYIYFQDPFDRSGQNDKCFGEIHQLFGAAQVNSGEYTIINAQSRYEKTATPIDFTVAEDWTMAYYSTGETGGTNYGSDVNMGGFQIRTLTAGNPAPAVLDINSSQFSGASVIQAAVHDSGENVPYILCIPYPYTRYNYNGNTPGPETGTKSTYVWAWPVEYQTICDENGDGPYPDFAGWVRNHNNNTDWYKNKNNGDYEQATVEELLFQVSPMTQEEINANGGGNNNQKQASRLGNNGLVTLVKNSSAQAALAGNLTNANLSTGALTYYFLNDGNNQTEQAINFPWNPGVVGERTIIVRQAADANYEAGETRFRLRVVEEQQTGTGDAGFGLQVALTDSPRGNGNWGDGNNHTVYMVDGQTLDLDPYLNYNATGTITVSAFDAGGTQTQIDKSIGATISKDDDKVRITAAANASGIGSITLHYSGDANTAAKDITYTLEIASATRFQIQVVSSTQNLFNVNGYSGSAANFWLNKEEGADKLLLDQYYGQPWVLEQVPGNTGYYYLYNTNNSKYVYLDNNSTYRPAFTTNSATPGERGMFAIEAGGKIKCKTSGYLGNDSDGHVYLDKGNYVTWRLVTAN